MLLRRLLIALALVLIAVPANAGMMMLGMGPAPPSGPPLSYTPLCSIVGCTYAYSTERQMVASATAAFQVYRTVDSTTQSVGFLSGGRVNTAAVDAFCNAAVGGVISRDCFISEVYDQTGNGCNIYNSTSTGMPSYMVWPAHSGLPLFQKSYQGGNLNFLLDNNGGSTRALIAPCSSLTGGAQSLFFAGNSLYGSNIGGQANLQENIPGVITGTMWGAYIGIRGLPYDTCSLHPALPCGGLDTEGEGPQANFTPTANGDVIDIATTAGGKGPSNIWMNGVQVTTNEMIATALATQSRMSWGTTGDHTSNGPALVRSEAFYNGALASAQVANLYGNETAFAGSLSMGYQGPGDLFIETSATPGLAGGHIDQMQWLSQALSLRKAYAGYEGPALNVCKGQTVTGAGNCEDIGWVSNIVDSATMSAFCGPVSGLNNCAVQTWYNEALNQNSMLNSHNTSLDATAVSTSHRPTIVWSGCGTTTITVCIATSSTNYFTTNGIGISSGGYTMAAIATRTSGTTLSAIYSSSTGTGPETFLGFAASANNCFGQAHNGGGSGVTVACQDLSVHSIIYDVSNTPSANLWVDGVAGTAVTGSIGYSASGLGVGATGAGTDPCTCQLSEVLVYADTNAPTFPTGIGSSGVATLLSNEQNAYGFGAQNVATVSLSNENMVPNAPTGTVIATLSTTITGGGPCTTCIYTMQTSGTTSDGNDCAAANNFEIINPGVAGPGTANLAVLNPSITGPQLLGGGYDTRGYPCVKSTPTVGTSLIRGFSVQVRRPTFVALAPYGIQYTSPATPGTVLATLAPQIYGASPAASYSVQSNAACLDTAGHKLIVAGNNLEVDPAGGNYTATGFCGINLTQAGVETATGGSTYVAGVFLTQGGYQGPGDFYPYQAWGGLRCFAFASTTGSQKAIRLIRDSDLAQQDINCLSNGDLDYASAAIFLNNSFGYVYHYYDQTGNGNDEKSWQEYQHGLFPANLYVLKWLPPFIFNCNNTSSLACILSQNSNDRLFQNVSFVGSSPTGMLTSVLLNPISENQVFMVANCASSASPCPGLYAASGTNVIDAGTATGTNLTSFSGSTTPGSLNTWYALAGGIDGASSFINANGTIATGTVPATTIGNTLTLAGSFGGGGFGNGGLMEEWGVSFNVFSDQGHAACVNESAYWNFPASC